MSNNKALNKSRVCLLECKLTNKDKYAGPAVMTSSLKNIN